MIRGTTRTRKVVDTIHAALPVLAKSFLKSNNTHEVGVRIQKKKKKGDRMIDSSIVQLQRRKGKETGKRDARAATSRLVTAVSYLLRRLQDPLLDATVLLARTRTRAHDLGHDSLSLSLTLSPPVTTHRARASAPRRCRRRPQQVALLCFHLRSRTRRFPGRPAIRISRIRTFPWKKRNRFCQVPPHAVGTSVSAADKVSALASSPSPSRASAPGTVC